MALVDDHPSRRRVLRAGGLAVAAWSLRGIGIPEAFAQAQALIQTPAQTEGPFYPDHLPLDKDNDLVLVEPGQTLAGGEITHLSGRVLSQAGSPLRGVTVEIWQCDSHGVYLHSRSGNTEKGRDSAFQGFGRFETNTAGEYRFRTIKPVPYPGRTPHIHFKIKRGDRDLLVTQCYIKGDPKNAGDGVLRGIGDARARESVMVDFTPIPGDRAGALSARFDIVLGVTPSE
jgi:protocatechuate 3,4-dioxygenase, beta subunit